MGSVRTAVREVQERERGAGHRLRWSRRSGRPRLTGGSCDRWSQSNVHQSYYSTFILFLEMFITFYVCPFFLMNIEKGQILSGAYSDPGPTKLYIEGPCKNRERGRTETIQLVYGSRK